MKANTNKTHTLNSALQPVLFCILIHFFYIGLIACAYVIIAPILQLVYGHLTASLVGLNDTLRQMKFK